MYACGETILVCRHYKELKWGCDVLLVPWEEKIPKSLGLAFAHFVPLGMCVRILGHEEVLLQLRYTTDVCGYI